MALRQPEHFIADVGRVERVEGKGNRTFLLAGSLLHCDHGKLALPEALGQRSHRCGEILLDKFVGRRIDPQAAGPETVHRAQVEGADVDVQNAMLTERDPRRGALLVLAVVGACLLIGISLLYALYCHEFTPRPNTRIPKNTIQRSRKSLSRSFSLHMFRIVSQCLK
jgi:hypothetical protein